MLVDLGPMRWPVNNLKHEHAWYEFRWVTKDGELFAGKVSIMGEFSFRAVDEYTHTTGFNTNSNGRWVYEGLEPGTYEIFIEGTDKFKDWQWIKEGVTIKAGDSPLFEINLNK